jgi:nucleotide-binding universal stress UspA family protein
MRETTMTYATAMVSLAVDQPNEALLDVAGQVAEQFGARIIGIAASMFSPPMYFIDGDVGQRLVEEGQAAIEQRMVNLDRQFREAMNGRAREVEWRSAMELPARYIAREARAADLLIVSGDGAAPVDPFAVAGPSDLVLQAGRPLLIVPATVRWLDLRSVLVAWKDCAEARRAVADSLPLLRKAKEVTVAGIVEEASARAVVQKQVEDVIAWLSRHGITAVAQVAEKIGDAALQIDRIAAATGAGVVVAGAYGHSRFREWVLGGVTRHLVGQMDRCVLLSR